MNIEIYTLYRVRKEAKSDFSKRETGSPCKSFIRLKRPINAVAVQVLNHTEYQMILKFVNIWQFSLQLAVVMIHDLQTMVGQSRGSTREAEKAG